MNNRNQVIYTRGVCKTFILVFKLPKKTPAFGVKINRMLREIGAEKVSNSVWRSGDLRALTKMAVLIRNGDGTAKILEEKIVF